MEVIDAELEEEISLASAHTPEEGEGSEQEEEEEQGLVRKKRRLKKVASTASTLEPTELDDDDSSSSSPMARDPVAATPLRTAPPSSASEFGTLLNFHNLVDVDEGEDARYVFVLLVHTTMYLPCIMLFCLIDFVFG